MDFATLNNDSYVDEDWADDYSEGSDEIAESGTITKSLDDIREEFGFNDCTDLMFGSNGGETLGDSEDSDDDDDDTTPIEFDDLATNPNASNTRKQLNSHCGSTPFWFGDEDSRTWRVIALFRHFLIPDWVFSFFRLQPHFWVGNVCIESTSNGP